LRIYQANDKIEEAKENWKHHLTTMNSEMMVQEKVMVGAKVKVEINKTRRNMHHA
jgi:hypothetical protein